MADITFWTVGDKTHGMGHVVRCLTLADELRLRGHGVEFRTEHETPGAGRIRSRHAVIDYHPLDWSWMRQGGQALIVDLEGGASRMFLAAARPHFTRIVSIAGSGWTLKDEAAVGELSDLIVYQSVLLDPSLLMVDPRFALLGASFEGHILIGMGGTDPHGITDRVRQALAGIERPFVVMNGADDMLAGMNGAALFVGALGMSAYEAAAVGVPALLTGWSEDHIATAEKLRDLGACAVLGQWDRLDYRKLPDAVRLILDDHKRWAAMSAAGRRVIDGQGVRRVAEAIESMIKVGN